MKKKRELVGYTTSTPNKPPTIQNEKEERTSRLYDSKSEQKKTAGQILIKILQYRIHFDWGISFLFNCKD